MKPWAAGGFEIPSTKSLVLPPNFLYPQYQCASVALSFTPAQVFPFKDAKLQQLPGRGDAARSNGAARAEATSSSRCPSRRADSLGAHVGSCDVPRALQIGLRPERENEGSCQVCNF